jgi:hypothetical protein
MLVARVILCVDCRGGIGTSLDSFLARAHVAVFTQSIVSFRIGLQRQ